jgi:hypothetical protein
VGYSILSKTAIPVISEFPKNFYRGFQEALAKELVIFWTVICPFEKIENLDYNL